MGISRKCRRSSSIRLYLKSKIRRLLHMLKCKPFSISCSSGCFLSSKLFKTLWPRCHSPPTKELIDAFFKMAKNSPEVHPLLHPAALHQGVCLQSHEACHQIQRFELLSSLLGRLQAPGEAHRHREVPRGQGLCGKVPPRLRAEHAKLLRHAPALRASSAGRHQGVRRPSPGDH